MNVNTLIDLVGYGVVGLGAIFAFFSFSLLKKEQSEKEPRSKVLLSINCYFLLSIILCGAGLVSEYIKFGRDKEKIEIVDLIELEKETKSLKELHLKATARIAVLEVLLEERETRISDAVEKLGIERKSFFEYKELQEKEIIGLRKNLDFHKNQAEQKLEELKVANEVIVKTTEDLQFIKNRFEDNRDRLFEANATIRESSVALKSLLTLKGGALKDIEDVAGKTFVNDDRLHRFRLNLERIDQQMDKAVQKLRPILPN